MATITVLGSAGREDWSDLVDPPGTIQSGGSECEIFTSGDEETEDGEMLRIQAGDVMVTPKGSRGIWHTRETIVKFYAIYRS